jgi:hypothetical protein
MTIVNRILVVDGDDVPAAGPGFVGDATVTMTPP